MKTNKFAELIFEDDLVFIEDSAETKLNGFFDKINIEAGNKYNNIPVERINTEGKTNDFIKLVALTNKQGEIINIEFTYNYSHLSGNVREASMNSALIKINSIKSLKETLLGESKYGNFRYKQIANKMRGF